MHKQVAQSHYNFRDYMTKNRWISVWHQVDEVTKFTPRSVLEVGPGTGIFKAAATTFGLNVQTLDIDPALKPDYTAEAHALPLPSDSFDVVCAFQVLEHMPFATSMQALAECCRVARAAVIISLPDTRTIWASTLTIPRLGAFRFAVSRPFFRPRPMQFNGEHYWEVNARGYELQYVIKQMRAIADGYSLCTYRVHENQYHRFFILTKEYKGQLSSQSSSRRKIPTSMQAGSREGLRSAFS